MTRANEQRDKRTSEGEFHLTTIRHEDMPPLQRAAWDRLWRRLLRLAADEPSHNPP